MPDAERTRRGEWLASWERPLAVLVPLGVLALWHLSGTNYLFDDAFISFRYARHLAAGQGLVWNAGGEPTQGYTNFLLILLIAAGQRIGIPPASAAHLVNAAGLAMVAWACHALSVRVLPASPWRLLPPLAVGASVASLQNVMAGMETGLWAGLLFLGASLVPRAADAVSGRSMTWIVALSFLAVLTRPDSILVSGFWLVALAASADERARPTVLRATLVLALLLGVYAAWAELYFGDFLPNSFYLKLHAPTRLPGLSYVIEFLLTERPMLLVPALLSPLLWRERRRLRPLWPYVGIFALLGFYVFTSPLMGHYFRFLYPVDCLLRATAALALALAGEALAAAGLRWGLRLLAGVAAMGLLLHDLPLSTLDQFRYPYVWPSLRAEERFGRALGRLDSISEVRVAFADAGAVPYFSRAYSIDVVGLNDNRIAREGRRRGAAWVIDDVLGQQPDLVGLYALPDGRIFDGGHGVIGNAYSALYVDPRFASRYRWVGGASLGWMDLHWFARADSPRYTAIQAAIASVSEFAGAQLRP